MRRIVPRWQCILLEHYYTSESKCLSEVDFYLIQKIHLQVVLPVMTPPSTGPQTPATATEVPSAPTTIGRNLGGEISGQMTMVSEYNPAPPIPWNALKIMSCSTVWASPHAREKQVKKNKAAKIIILRPYTSASRVKQTPHPKVVSILLQDNVAFIPMSANMYDRAAHIVWS